MKQLKAPFPYFGGKSKISSDVWNALGDVDNYIEPFMGSCAVLLARPHDITEQHIKTVNDVDCLLCNFWRALSMAPDEVAHYADNPVNEADLHARHSWLVNNKNIIAERFMGDPEYYDAKAAGWWVWGICCWIGGGWCSGQGPWHSVDGELQKIKTEGKGINRQLPHLSNGRGVNRVLPHLGDYGCGVNKKLPAEENIENRAAYWLMPLAKRLRKVRVTCGSWDRVCRNTAVYHVMKKSGICGVFLDPPYSEETGRDMNLYANESGSVAHDVRKWCIENGHKENIRIVLAGYDTEHSELEEKYGWKSYLWDAGKGYAGQNKNKTNINGKRETLWFSPHCLEVNQK